MKHQAADAISAALPLEGNRGAFAAWAKVYDAQDNPLLALEERFLSRLLPEVRDADVLDIGCGTGRWLTKLAGRLPHSLRGMDTSPEMLSEAAKKRIPGTQLALCSQPPLPSPDCAADLILSSFVASYVDDLSGFAAELYRVARMGGDVFVTDMHPDTAMRLGWQRGFRGLAGAVHVRSIERTMQETSQTFVAAGFEECAFLEPGFGEAERKIFAAQHKIERFDEASGLPAIYLLHLRKPVAAARVQVDERRSVCLNGTRCALGARETVSGSVQIKDGQIASVRRQELRAGRDGSVGSHMDLHGFLVLPGLVNAHDHLEFGLFPRLGNGPYKNATQWAHDIQTNEAERIATHRAVPKEVRLWWGGIRNLLCGVTTVCHHNPIHTLLQDEAYPVRVLSHFGWEHSLGLAHNIASSLEQTPEDAPFILHACEGVDAEAAIEPWELDALGALGPRSVLVHGLALDEAGAALIDERRASVILCPSSNQFLFGRVPSAPVLQSLQRLALASDSPLTARGDLLDEIRFTSRACGISMERIYSFVTESAASILRLRSGEGTIRVGSRADLIAVPDRLGDPADVLGALTWRDIELVLVGGQVQLASAEILSRLSAHQRDGLSLLSVEGVARWVRAPIAKILREAEAVLGKGELRLGRLSIESAPEKYSQIPDVATGNCAEQADTVGVKARAAAHVR